MTWEKIWFFFLLKANLHREKIATAMSWRGQVGIHLQLDFNIAVQS